MFTGVRVRFSLNVVAVLAICKLCQLHFRQNQIQAFGLCDPNWLESCTILLNNPPLD